MAEGMSATLANACLANEASAYDNIQLHIGPPGAAGTSQPAVETDRQAVTWSTPASGAFENTADLEWTSVAASEDYTHFTAKDAPTAGNFGFSGTVTANPVTAGDTFTIPAGELTASFPLAS